MLRPYVSAGFSDQSIGQNGRSGRNGSTFANVGGGAKLYFTDNFYARAGVEAQYNIDQGDTEWAPSVGIRSEEHTSELQSLMRTSYAVFCLKKKNSMPYYDCKQKPIDNKNTHRQTIKNQQKRQQQT